MLVRNTWCLSIHANLIQGLEYGIFTKTRHVRCDHSILQVQPWNFRLRTQVTQVFLQSFGIFWVYSSRNSYSSFKGHNIRHHSSPPSPHHGLNGSLTSGSNSPVGRTNGFPCHHNLAALPTASLLSIPKMALVVAPKKWSSEFVQFPICTHSFQVM